MNEINKDWMRSRYELKIMNPDSSIGEGNIYLYDGEQGVCLATKENTICSSCDKYQELKELKPFLDKGNQNFSFVYEKAVKFNIAPKLRGITKPLPLWHGYNNPWLLHFVPLFYHLSCTRRCT